jgi:hypothetical protein
MMGLTEAREYHRRTIRALLAIARTDATLRQASV